MILVASGPCLWINPGQITEVPNPVSVALRTVHALYDGHFMPQVRFLLFSSDQLLVLQSHPTTSFRMRIFAAYLLGSVVITSDENRPPFPIKTESASDCNEHDVVAAPVGLYRRDLLSLFWLARCIVSLHKRVWDSVQGDIVGFTV